MTQDEATTPAVELAKVWIEHGILYNVYGSSLNVDIASEASERSLKVMSEQKLTSAPVIADFTRVMETRFDLKITDYAEIIRSLNLLRHLSSIWIVGAPQKVRAQLTVASNAFFGGHMHFVDSMEDAKQAVVKEMEKKQDVLLP